MLLTLEKVAILKSVDIFSHTPDYVLASVSAIAEEVEVEPGETFIQKGAVEYDMYIIIEGEVRVHDGDRTLATLKSGQVVGEMEVLSPAPRLASVTAVGETRLFHIHKDAFDELMADHFEISQSIIAVLVDRFRARVMNG